MLGESVPDERTALLISSLVDVHEKLIVPKGRVREARRRAGEIVEGIREDERAIVSAVRVALSNSDSATSVN